jgi:two-component system sensor kinase FixL
MPSFLYRTHLPVVTCDKPRITEVFRNLITNAIKYNDKPQKTVEIGYIEKMETKNGIEEQVFYVRDNGIGIEKEFFEEIFRIFKRLNEEDDDKKGTGVGLTFVRKIIDRHGGSIWVESEFGKNTTFYFTLKQGGAYATV